MLHIFKEWSQSMRKLNRRSWNYQCSSLPNLSVSADLKLHELTKDPGDSCSHSSYTITESCKDINVIETKDSKLARKCECTNCAALPNLTECGVCLEPLQGHGIEYCPICFNLTCTSCASRLACCAFCRTALLMRRNRALERLLDRLVLPCKNSRWGCEVLLNVDIRFGHEAICNFYLVMCPQDLECCSWQGPACKVESHMKKVHQLETLQDHGVSVQIYSFRRKVYSHKGRQYTISLACFDQLFFVKIIVFEGKLTLSCTQVGYIKRAIVQSSLPKYGVSIKIHGSCKSLKGILPFEKHFFVTRKIEIECQRLYSNVKDIDEKDLVKIDLLIVQVKNKIVDENVALRK